jgi:tetratricopeptide (TPR) repeat protein
VGAESGLNLHYDRTAVSHWLAGVRPAPHVAALIAESLSRRLGRPVTVAETGLNAPRHPFGTGVQEIPDGDPDGVTQLIELSSADGDLSRQALLRGSVYSVAALSVPGWTQLPPTVWPTPRPGTRVGMPQVCMIEAMTTMFSDADTAFGGGHIRGALISYLSGDATVWLRARTAPTVYRRLLSSVAELGYLAAFVCFDSRLHGLAQRYHLAALRLAAQAGDRSLYATVLRGMSVQAHSLGHHHEALRLAETAAQLRDAVPHATAASLVGQLAVAAAANGDWHDTIAYLGAAERYLERSDASGGPLGAYHRAALDHQLAEALAARGDREGAIRALTASIRNRPLGERRSRALTLAKLADLQLGAGHLEAACTTGRRFCEDYPYLDSARADSALRLLHARLRPYQRNADAAALLERVRILIHSGTRGRVRG